MNVFSATALVLRRTPYGERDLVVHLLTSGRGRLAAMAKSAVGGRRFAGMLEPLRILNVVCDRGRGGLPLLREASLAALYESPRRDVFLAAMAGVWTEMLDVWIPEGRNAEGMYELLRETLDAAETGLAPPHLLHLAFQAHFLGRAGLSPNLGECQGCRRSLDGMTGTRIWLDAALGGIACPECRHRTGRHALEADKGTAGLLAWLARVPLDRVGRLRCSPVSLDRAGHFLRIFVAYHLGRPLKSQDVLRQLTVPPVAA